MYRGFVYFPDERFLPALYVELVESGVTLVKSVRKGSEKKRVYMVYLQAIDRPHYQFFIYRLMKSYKEAGLLLDFKRCNIIKKGVLK